MSSAQLFNNPARRVFFLVNPKGKIWDTTSGRRPIPVAPGRECIACRLSRRGVGRFLRSRAEWARGDTAVTILDPAQHADFIAQLDLEFGMPVARTDRKLSELKLSCGDELILARTRPPKANEADKPVRHTTLAKSYRFEAFRVGCPSCLGMFAAMSPEGSPEDRRRALEEALGGLGGLFGGSPPRSRRPDAQASDTVRITIEVPASAVLGALLNGLLGRLFGGGSGPSPFGPFGPSDGPFDGMGGGDGGFDV